MSRSQFMLHGRQLLSGERVECNVVCSACRREAVDHVIEFQGGEGRLYCPQSLVESAPESALAQQVGGDHYKNRAIQPIEYCHKNKLGPCESAVVKYITRWREKGGLQDLEKAKHTIDLLIDLEGLKQNVGADHGQTHPG